LKEGNLKPGTYLTEGFAPTFAFELAEKGWVSYATDLERFLLFALPPEDYLIFLRPLHVYDPASGGDLERVPADLIDWLSKHPDLEVGAPQGATVGGLEGRYVDVVVADEPRWHGDACGKGECVTLSPSYGAGPSFHLLAGEKARFYVLPAGGEQLVIVIESSPEDFASFEKSAVEVLDTVTFTS
jgi:hypothetical protein